jgi:hypothetical protein
VNCKRWNGRLHVAATASDTGCFCVALSDKQAVATNLSACPQKRDLHNEICSWSHYITAAQLRLRACNHHAAITQPSLLGPAQPAVNSTSGPRLGTEGRQALTVEYGSGAQLLYLDGESFFLCVSSRASASSLLVWGSLFYFHCADAPNMRSSGIRRAAAHKLPPSTAVASSARWSVTRGTRHTSFANIPLRLVRRHTFFTVSRRSAAVKRSTQVHSRTVERHCCRQRQRTDLDFRPWFIARRGHLAFGCVRPRQPKHSLTRRCGCKCGESWTSQASHRPTLGVPSLSSSV